MMVAEFVAKTWSELLLTDMEVTGADDVDSKDEVEMTLCDECISLC